ncbi:MAG TPA: GNAT family N-acetyltransferase [Gammaproteobacteria bacterium]|nr:GNAT family N-acetyltransferase [Gammaproteobacteria bacterium]
MMGIPGIRPIQSADHDAALRILRQLRPTLNATDFEARLARQAALGYRLIGSFTPQLSGVLGMRATETLARGHHLHVDDLVVDNPFRGQGLGRALLSFAEAEARRLGCVAVFLDSFENVLPFYQASGYAAHDSVLVKKSLAD